MRLQREASRARADLVSFVLVFHLLLCFQAQTCSPFARFRVFQVSGGSFRRSSP